MANDDTDGDVIKLLVTTDNHLGYAEKDPVRGNDSLIAFEEVLKHARREDVDMILLGGDLFHENKPSRKTFHACTELLRQYCLGDRPCRLEFLSDPTVNFQHTRFPVVNYEDPNFNIAMPVFSIHGNHDDPVGHGNLCALDVLSAAGLVNYFGKATNLDEIKISPILLQKGCTKLALYGLGAIRDERLHRLFTSKKVTMLRPREDADAWFNVFVVHQNRTKHSSTNYLPDQMLDDFLDLVIWGHEHECLIEPEQVASRGFWISQPGSTVATSLSEGEAKPKYCSLLEVSGKQFKMRKIPLTSVRPFYFENIVLSDVPSLSADDPDHGRRVETICKARVEALIERAEAECASISSRQQRLPLVRLRVDHSGGFDTFSMVRFGQQFVDKVANPKDLVLFSKKRQTDSKVKDEPDFAEIEGDLRSSSTCSVEEMVKEYFEKAEDKLRLALLTERGIGMAVRAYVDKQEADAIKVLVDHQVTKTQQHLKAMDVKSEDEIAPAVEEFREECKRSQREEADVNAIIQASAQSARHDDIDVSFGPSEGVDASGISGAADIGDEDSDNNARRGRGRGSRGTRGARGGGRGSRGARSIPKAPTAGSRGNSRQATTVLANSDEERPRISPWDRPQVAAVSTTAKRKRGTDRSGVTYIGSSDDSGGEQQQRKRKQ